MDDGSYTGEFHFLRVSFMITGHMNFACFPVYTSRAYNQADVFNTNELALVMWQAEMLTPLLMMEVLYFCGERLWKVNTWTFLGFDCCMPLL